MNFLLLLSALLSALTGVGASARAQDRAQSVAEGSVATQRAALAPRRIAIRPVDALPGLAQTARIAPEAIFSFVAAEPLFAGRRRE